MKNRNFSKNDFRTPQRFTIGGRDIQEEKLLSEGGYGYIWKAYDVNTKESFALKKMICQGPERSQMAKNELDILKKLPVSENIMRFYDGQIIPIEDGCIVIFLLEFCSGGSIFDLMVKYEKIGFSESQLISMINAIAKGLKIMHSLKPPIAHRDIKIENVLINNNVFKLCDFGSCSSETVDFSRISPSDFYSYEEFYEKNTTLMYRPPEMSDLYLKFEVGTKVDIWMLGCVLYTICFFKHPFQEASKLAISTANYTFPKFCKFSPKILDFIRHMLTPNPKFRPDINEILEITENFDRLASINLNPQALEIKMKAVKDEADFKNYEKSLKPIKHFDGDIPMDELLNIKKKIENDGGDKNKARQKKPLYQNPKNFETESKNDWNEVPSKNTNNNSSFNGFGSYNNTQNNKGFDSFNKNTQDNNKGLQKFSSNFNEWKDDKNNFNLFSFDKKEQKVEINQNVFSGFENNFNFGNSNKSSLTNNNPNTQAINNPKNDFSNFNNNFNFTKSAPQQSFAGSQDYSQFFNNNNLSQFNNAPQVQCNNFPNNNQIPFNIPDRNKQTTSPERSKQLAPSKPIPSQTMDLIGLEEVHKPQVNQNQINLLEDLNSLNFN